MGGFGLDYVPSTEHLVFTADPFDPSDLVRTPSPPYRVDDARTLLVWTNPSQSGRVRTVVADGSAAPAFAVGTTVEFQTSIFADIHAVQLDGDNWLMYYQQGATVPDTGFSYQRFSISGVTISLGTYEEHASQWFQDAPAIPDAFYEGHADGVGGDTNVTYTINGAMSGIDFDHVIVDATLSWINSGIAHSEPKIAIMDLTTNLPVASYNAAALGYTPGSLAPFGRTGDWPAYSVPGLSYRVGSDGSGNPLAALIESTSSTTITATVTDLPSSYIGGSSLGAFSRAPDGTIWTGFRGRTFHTWTPADPIGGHWTIYSLVGAVATSHSYSFENVAGTGSTANIVAAGESGLMIGDYSWLTDDTHIRMDRSAFVDLAPHQTLVAAPSVYGGTSVDGYIVMAYQQGTSPASAYVALAQEVPLIPEARFTFDPKLVNATHTPVAFDGTQTQSGVDPGDTDYYWHPVVGWHWEYDDGNVADTTVATTSHLYRRISTTHVAGSQIVDVPSPLPRNWGTTGYYLPVLIVTDTLGHASLPASGLYIHDFFEDRIQVLIAQVYQRSFPRDDGLGASTARSFPPSVDSIRSYPHIP